jgi:hypothetical protein
VAEGGQTRAKAVRREPVAAGRPRGPDPGSGRRAAGLDARRVRRGHGQAPACRQPQRALAVSGAPRDQRQKKSLRAAEQDRADVARARRRWIRRQGLLDSSALVFIDETSANTSMARLYGRCPRGERLIGRVPFGTWETLTFVAGLRCDGMTAPLVIEGAMNGEIFLSYVEQCLAPALNRGDIVVMDNLRAHKVAGVKEDRGRRCRIAIPAPVLARSQSDRDVLQQTQGVSAQSRRADTAEPAPSNRPFRAAPRRRRMRELLRSCRICFNMNGIRSR